MLGRNGLGQLGDGTTQDRPAPTPVHGIFRAGGHGQRRARAHVRCPDAPVASSAGERTGSANSATGSSNDREPPVRVRGLDGAAVAVSAGGRHTCAVLARGEVECWGADYSGQVGDGRVQDRAGPVRVRGVSRAVGVSAGRAYTCAVERAGAVKCWGANAYGQLGNGTVDRSAPPDAGARLTRPRSRRERRRAPYVRAAPRRWRRVLGRERRRPARRRQHSRAATSQSPWTGSSPRPP